MNDQSSNNRYGVLTAPATLTFERLLPGTLAHMWSRLTDSDLRRQWLAAGKMKLEIGAPFELLWRNDELSASRGQRPAGFPDEFRMQSRITALDPQRKLALSWEDTGDATFTLVPQGKKVLLGVTHLGLTDRDTLLSIAAGWHMHLDILAAKERGEEPEFFWDGWSRLRKDYELRLAK